MSGNTVWRQGVSKEQKTEKDTVEGRKLQRTDQHSVRNYMENCSRMIASRPISGAPKTSWCLLFNRF